MILRGSGVPDQRAFGLRVTQRDFDSVLTILFAYLVFGWCVTDNICFIPDHGRQIVQLDHHHVIHVQYSHEAEAVNFGQYMAALGYDLPTDPPDPTFIRPYWMG